MSPSTEPSAAERVASLVEIQSVLNKYCILAREKAKFDEIGALFTSDGSFRFGPSGEIVVPSSKIAAVLGSREATFIRHHLTSWDAKFVSPHEARVESFFFAITDEAPAGVIDHSGRWVDVFVQVDGEWRIQDRLVVGESMHEQGWLAKRSKEF